MKNSNLQPEFVSVKLKVSVLKQLLRGNQIHLCDIHGTSHKQKRCLQELLLQTVVERPI